VEATCGLEIFNSAGLCIFGGFCMPPDAAVRFIGAATGWDFKGEDVIQAGKRIMNMRYAFNLREGQKPNDEENRLSRRCVGDPPLKEGPLKGVTLDCEKMAHAFLESMGWDEKTLLPTRKSLEEIGGMEDVIRDLYR